ncbi:MAG: DUF1801 domain-containing protein [Bacteroidales bacterium]|nr:DUF1801 domain-containing protein [Bacteroidales bacterium]
MNRLSIEVTAFLSDLKLPLRLEIDALRRLILESNAGLAENIKWNGPNYTFGDQDRITMRIHPPKQVQLIFHRGAKKLAQPEKRLIEVKTKKLIWKENDRAVMSFKNMAEIEDGKSELTDVVRKWIDATK